VVDRSIPKTLTVEQIAAGAGVSERSVRRWCESGAIPARKIAGEWRVKPAILAMRMPDLWEEYAESRSAGMNGF